MDQLPQSPTTERERLIRILDGVSLASLIGTFAILFIGRGCPRMGPVSMLLFGLFMFCATTSGLISEAIRLRSGQLLSRSEHPVIFWLAVTVGYFGSITIGAIGAVALILTQ